jgi:hypothetical protein
MKPQVIIGIVLIVLGVIALVHKGFSYTTRERVVDIGPIKADADVTHNVPIEPIAGGLLLAGGVVLVVLGNRTT